MITDRLIHIHVPRTAGTMFRALLDSMPGLVIHNSVAHLPYWLMASHFTGEVPPAVAFIRNPWEWYVSQWCWVAEIGQRGFQGDFLAFMAKVRHNVEHDIMHPNFRRLSFWWMQLQAGRADYVGRFENLHEEIVAVLLATCGDLVDEGWIRGELSDIGIWRPGRVDGKPHGPYQEYYTDEIRSWVAEWDEELIKRFGYTF